MDRLVKGGERVGEDTLQTGHRLDLNLDQFAETSIWAVSGC